MKPLLIALILTAHACAQSATPAAVLSQQHAVDKYPDIGVKGSPLNRAFIDVVKHWQTWKPLELMRDNWPELVAEEAVRALLARQEEEARRKTTTIRIR